MTTRPSVPSVSHLVLNVRDIEASHRFYTDLLGFAQCGRLRVPESLGIDMRFYRGAGDHHHDIALVQMRDPSIAREVIPWTMFPPYERAIKFSLPLSPTKLKHLKLR